MDARRTAMSQFQNKPELAEPLDGEDSGQDAD